MLSSKIIEYEAKMSLAEMTIKNIGTMGIDTSSFLNQLNKLKEAVSDRTNEINDDNDLMTEIYIDATDALETFLEDLNQYKVYYQALNRCLYIYNSQNEGNNKNELSVSIDELIECLDSIKSSSSIKDKKMIESLYEVIFNIIKLEFELNGSSKLLSYCRESEIDSIYISKFIVREIETLRKTNYDVSDIDLKMMKINSEDNESMYLDEELVALISICRNKETYLKELSLSIKKLISGVKTNSEKIKNLLERKEELEYKSKEYRLYIKDSNSLKIRRIAKKTVPLLISIGALFSITYGLNRVFRGNIYGTDISTYSTKTGYENKDKEYKRRLYNSRNEKTDKKTTLTIYDPWMKEPAISPSSYERLIREVDLSDINMDDLKAYLDLNLSELGYEFTDYPESTINLSSKDLYDEPIYEVTRETQDLQDKKPGKIFNENAAYKATYILCCCTLSMGYFMLFAFGIINGEGFGIIVSLTNLIEEINSLDSNHWQKSNMNYALKQLKSIMGELDELIQNNKEINARYKAFMEKPENKRLLERYEEGKALIEEYCSQIEESNRLVLKA